MSSREVVHVNVRNGMTLGYMVALVNAVIELLISFGVHVTDGQHAAIVATVNACVLIVARVLSLPYKSVKPPAPVDKDKSIDK